MNMLGVQQDLKSFANQAIGCWPGSVHFHSSQQDQYGNKACIETDSPVFSDKQPKSGTDTPANSYFTNQFNHPIDKTFSMSGQF